MKIKWRLYVDIYDTISRTDLPSVDLSSGVCEKKDEIKSLFQKVADFLPRDANYFKDCAVALKTKSIVLESPLCYTSPASEGNEDTRRYSPALIFDLDCTDITIYDLHSLLLESSRATPEKKT